MERSYQYDIVVVGGGTAGVAAAVGAAKAGAKTLLVERNAYLGGEAANSGVNCFCGFYTCGSDPVRVVKGIGQLVLDEMRALGPTIAEEISASGNRDIIFQPEYLKCALDNLLEKEHVDYFLHTVLIGAETVENEIRTIQCADDEGLFTVSAKAFVDATGDANLSRLAGAKLIWGTDGGHPQAATLTFRLSGVAADVDLSAGSGESEGRRNQKSYQRKRIYPQNGKLRDRPCPSSEHYSGRTFGRRDDTDGEGDEKAGARIYSGIANLYAGNGAQ